MPQITYIQADGERHAVGADSGVSVMKAAISHGVPGIVAECGGSLMCATCHVYVDEAFADALPVPGDDEDEMLEVAASERRGSSRLSCQIEVTEELDGLVVHVPERQA
ncbi:2Fe-2S iron-sulfur cluster-binding protein [Streptomyces sp. NPDC059255]|uniref:2Fe-2S iron-sulfur cluster-binding protein n=1 Tax=Streptomyces sp. NPDC059255 TaxID=3346793 RepID=UPI0036B033C0